MTDIRAFEFATAARIIFGTGSSDQVVAIATGLGKNVLLVSGGSAQDHASRLAQQLVDKKMAVTQCVANGEPDVASIEAGVQAAQGCDCVISIGGGSVIDTGKAIAGLLTNGGSVLDYVEVVGRGQALKQPAAPFIAIPTTAGTGAEVTRNAVIAVKDKQVKVSLRSPYLLPRVSVVDPALTYTMPPEVTASTGLDALTQLIEPYTCNRTNPITDALAFDALPRAVASLLAAYQDGTPQAREDMAYASLCSGLALANSGLGAVHGFASVLGGRYPIPHGVCCAALLPYVIEGNIRALQERDPESLTLRRYTHIRLFFDGVSAYSPNVDLPQRLHQLCESMRIPHLSTYGVTADAIPDLVAQTQQASSTKANPIKLTDDELAGILRSAL